MPDGEIIGLLIWTVTFLSLAVMGLIAFIAAYSRASNRQLERAMRNEGLQALCSTSPGVETAVDKDEMRDRLAESENRNARMKEHIDLLKVALKHATDHRNWRVLYSAMTDSHKPVLSDYKSIADSLAAAERDDQIVDEPDEPRTRRALRCPNLIREDQILCDACWRNEMKRR